MAPDFKPLQGRRRDIRYGAGPYRAAARAAFRGSVPDPTTLFAVVDGFESAQATSNGVVLQRRTINGYESETLVSFREDLLMRFERAVVLLVGEVYEPRPHLQVSINNLMRGLRGSEVLIVEVAPSEGVERVIEAMWNAVKTGKIDSPLGALDQLALAVEEVPEVARALTLRANFPGV
ncbi:hypothetical protein [Streptomyces sp. CA-106131]|uniref:hypothetical protein n=1 Tax=Streptomyces sp. CA-106131 TaxID=3240045 RepID=UPI003D93BE0E